jgi:hypothetical protein
MTRAETGPSILSKPNISNPPNLAYLVNGGGANYAFVENIGRDLKHWKSSVGGKRSF